MGGGAETGATYEDLPSIEEFVSSKREEIERWIAKHLTDREDGALLQRVLSGGKRLRPVLLLLVFEALGGKNKESALDVALSLELAHNASLIHDDIIDMDLYRRGKPSLWRQVGIGRAVIEGHRIINLAFKIVLEKGVEVAKIFLEAWDRASFGVLEEFLAGTSPLRELYLRIASEKTGHLFAAAAEVAAVLAEVKPQVRQALRRYGLLVGTLYQLADDYVEVTKSGGLMRLVFKLQQIEDFVRKVYFALKLGALTSVLRNLRSLWSVTTYISQDMRSILREIDSIVDSLEIDQRYKEMLKLYPRYCILEMLKEARR